MEYIIRQLWFIYSHEEQACHQKRNYVHSVLYFRSTWIYCTIYTACKEDFQHLGLDDDVPEEHLICWHKWLNDLRQLEQISTERCLKPVNFGAVTSNQLLVFSDASIVEYASVAYLRLCNAHKKIHCSFIVNQTSGINGPEFLKQSETDWPEQPSLINDLHPSDHNEKVSLSTMASSMCDVKPMDKLINQYSD